MRECVEGTAWAFKQLTTNDDGCQRLVEHECPQTMIKSFILHSNDGVMQKCDSEYLVHLLEAFVNLTFSDLGIEPLLNQDAIEQFTKMLDHDYATKILEECHGKIAELSLRVLGNMSINHDGKQECIDRKVIARSYKFLEQSHSRSYDDALNASLILMSISIHLEGKTQIIDEIDENGNPLILQAIVKRLQTQQYPNIRKNLKVCLGNVAELPRGFQDITRQLVEQIEILDEVFGPRAVKPLHNFLPKLSDYDSQLRIAPDEIMKSVLVIRALAVLFKKYQEEAAQVAIDETINFAEKLAPFINPGLGVQKHNFRKRSASIPLSSCNCRSNHEIIKHHQQSISGGGGPCRAVIFISRGLPNPTTAVDVVDESARTERQWRWTTTIFGKGRRSGHVGPHRRNSIGTAGRGVVHSVHSARERLEGAGCQRRNQNFQRGTITASAS